MRTGLALLAALLCAGACEGPTTPATTSLKPSARSNISRYRVYVAGVTLRDIGTLPGDIGAEATGVNDAGQVVGFSISPFGVMRAFLWDSIGGMRSLGTLGGNSSAAHGINSRGAIVGTSKTSLGMEHAFVWDPATSAMYDIGTFDNSSPTGSSSAARINDAGTVVGTSQARTGRFGSLPSAFSWNPATATMQAIPPQFQGPTYGNDINDAGDIAGFYNGASGAYTFENGALQFVSLPPPDAWGSANAINDIGTVVGWCLINPSHWVQHAFLTSPGLVPWDLGTFTPTDPTTQSVANDLTNDAFVVGNADRIIPLTGSKVSVAFLWANDFGLYNLGSLPSSFAFYQNVSAALAVNPQRIPSPLRVAGWSGDASGHARATVWTVQIGYVLR
jgi:probable HAF family extracellular repeat protein